MRSVLEDIYTNQRVISEKRCVTMLAPKGKTRKVYKKLIGEVDDNKDDPLSLSNEMLNKMKKLMPEKGKDKAQQKKPITGLFFELLMAELLVRCKVVPFYVQAELRHVPLSQFDFLCYHPNKPVFFSTKFSLGERWRQAAFEGDSLKKVYRNAECYLVTANRGDAQKRNKDIVEGRSMGIDKCLVMGDQELIDKLKDLSKREFTQGKDEYPIEKGRICYEKK